MPTAWGKAIRRKREKLRLTHHALSRLTGIKWSTIKEIEQGEGGGRMQTVVRICDELGLHVSLFDEDSGRDVLCR